MGNRSKNTTSLTDVTFAKLIFDQISSFKVRYIQIHNHGGHT